MDALLEVRKESRRSGGGCEASLARNGEQFRRLDAFAPLIGAPYPDQPGKSCYSQCENRGIADFTVARSGCWAVPPQAGVR